MVDGVIAVHEGRNTAGEVGGRIRKGREADDSRHVVCLDKLKFDPRLGLGV